MSGSDAKLLDRFMEGYGFRLDDFQPGQHRAAGGPAGSGKPSAALAFPRWRQGGIGALNRRGADDVRRRLTDPPKRR